MDAKKAIQLLSQDLRDEHAAIIQYLRHAYAFGEGELAAELEAIAREEMQHFRWLSEKIVELGGALDMTRGEVVFAGPLMVDMLQADADAEQHAIDQYRAHIAEINDPDITRLLERIIADETSHHGSFAHFVEKQRAQDPEAAVRMETTVAAGDRTKVDFLQKDLTHEYTVVLQYLAHAVTSGHCEVEHEMEWQAVEEMRHMGWLAEEMEGLGARPEMTHTPLALPPEPEKMLVADVAVEKEVAAEYRRQADAVDDPDLRTLFLRIAGEEDHHVVVFSELKEGLESDEATPSPPSSDQPGFTVGSLLDEPQR